MTIKLKRIILTLLTIGAAVFIFVMSATPADESQQMSLTVGETVCEIFVPGYSHMTDQQRYELAKTIDHPVRKAAHMTEYAGLGILLVMTLASYGISLKKRVPLALVLVALYAASDEFHQLFVPGRAGKITDVLYDTSGCIIGLLVYLAIQAVIRRCGEKKNG